MTVSSPARLGALFFALCLGGALSTLPSLAHAAQGATPDKTDQQARKPGASAKASQGTKAAKGNKPAKGKGTKGAKGAKGLKKPDTKGEHAAFASWKDVAAFIDRMVEKHGFDRAGLARTLNDTRYVESAIQLVKPAPPGKPKNWALYREKIVDAARIRGGVDFWQQHAEALQRAEDQYGVPAEIIVGIIGVETFYGRITGSFRVLDALTTLAFDYPETPNREARMALFRNELEQALVYAREMQIDPFTLTGSFAGAIGLPQFMPSNIRRYAVDFDQDGKIDLRATPADAIGSVAHFLVEHGWRRGEPYAFPARVSLTDAEGKADWTRFIGGSLKARFTLDELRAGGVTPSADTPAGLSYSLVDLQNGAEPTEYWLGAPNFFVITQYNRSYFYAMSVLELARAVKAQRSGAPGASLTSSG